MQYEVTIKLLLETPVDQDRVIRQVESCFAFGTALESVAEALKLDVDPHFLGAAVLATSAGTTTME
jgi:hypothetical protein